MGYEENLLYPVFIHSKKDINIETLNEKIKLHFTQILGEQVGQKYFSNKQVTFKKIFQSSNERSHIFLLSDTSLIFDIGTITTLNKLLVNKEYLVLSQDSVVLKIPKSIIKPVEGSSSEPPLFTLPSGAFSFSPPKNAENAKYEDIISNLYEELKKDTELKNDITFIEETNTYLDAKKVDLINNDIIVLGGKPGCGKSTVEAKLSSTIVRQRGCAFLSVCAGRPLTIHKTQKYIKNGISNCLHYMEFDNKKYSKKYIVNAPSLVISPLSFRRLFTCDNYENMSKSFEEFLDEVGNKIEVTWSTPEEIDYVLCLDELNESLQYLNSDLVANNNLNSYNDVYRPFEALVCNANKIIISGDDVTAEDIKHIHSMRKNRNVGCKIQYYGTDYGMNAKKINDYKNINRPFTILNHESNFRHILLQNLHSGKKIALTTRSQRFGEDLENEIKRNFPKKKVVRLDKKTLIDLRKKKEGILQCINEYIFEQEPDILIFSPSIGTGVSISCIGIGKFSLKGFYFDEIFQYGTTNQGVRLHKQHIGRIRELNPEGKIWIYCHQDNFTRNINLETDKKKILQYEYNSYKNITTYLNTRKINGDQFWPSHFDKKMYHHDKIYEDIIVNHIVEDNKDKNDFKIRLYKHLESRGNKPFNAEQDVIDAYKKISYIPSDVDIKADKKVKLNDRKLKRFEWTTNMIRYFHISRPTWKDYKDLSDEYELNEYQHLRKVLYDAADALGVYYSDIDKQFSPAPHLMPPNLIFDILKPNGGYISKEYEHFKIIHDFVFDHELYAKRKMSKAKESYDNYNMVFQHNKNTKFTKKEIAKEVLYNIFELLGVKYDNIDMHCSIGLLRFLNKFSFKFLGSQIIPVNIIKYFNENENKNHISVINEILIPKYSTSSKPISLTNIIGKKVFEKLKSQTYSKDKLTLKINARTPMFLLLVFIQKLVSYIIGTDIIRIDINEIPDTAISLEEPPKIDMPRDLHQFFICSSEPVSTSNQMSGNVTLTYFEAAFSLEKLQFPLKLLVLSCRNHLQKEKIYDEKAAVVKYIPIERLEYNENQHVTMQYDTDYDDVRNEISFFKYCAEETSILLTEINKEYIEEDALSSIKQLTETEASELYENKLCLDDSESKNKLSGCKDWIERLQKRRELERNNLVNFLTEEIKHEPAIKAKFVPGMNVKNVRKNLISERLKKHSNIDDSNKIPKTYIYSLEKKFPCYLEDKNKYITQDNNKYKIRISLIKNTIEFKREGFKTREDAVDERNKILRAIDKRTEDEIRLFKEKYKQEKKQKHTKKRKVEATKTEDNKKQRRVHDNMIFT